MLETLEPLLQLCELILILLMRDVLCLALSGVHPSDPRGQKKGFSVRAFKAN